MAGVAVIVGVLTAAAPAFSQSANADPDPGATGYPTVDVTIGSSSSGGGGPRGGGSGAGEEGGSGDGSAGGAACATTGADGKPGAPRILANPTPGARKLSLEDERAVAGRTIAVRADGYTPNEQVQLVLYSARTAIGSYAADASGTLSVRLQLPRDTTLGAHTLEATGWVSCAVAGGNFLVVSAAGSGSSMFPWIVWIIVIVALAIALIVVIVAAARGRLPSIFGANHRRGGAG